MKADRFNNLHIVEKKSFKSHDYWLVASDTDEWAVSDHGYYQSVRLTTPRSNGGSQSRSVTSTPQGQKILAFVKQEVTAWNHNAPYNPQFLGAQPARAGQDY